MVFGGFFRVVLGLQIMTQREMGVMTRLFIVPGVVVFAAARWCFAAC